LNLPKFAYLKPVTIAGAVSLLDAHHPGARVVAGGTELFPRMKYGLNCPETLIRLKTIPPQPPVTTEDKTLLVDPLITLAAVKRSETIRRLAPLLSDAAGKVASQEIRNMGTLGGNLCQDTRCLYYNQRHDYQYVKPCFKRGGDRCYFITKGRRCWAVFMADTAPALVALNASIKVAGAANGERTFPLAALYSGDAGNPLTLAPDEIITEIRIPPPSALRGSAFAKFSLRGGVEFAGLSVAAVLGLQDDGKTCVQVRIAVGAVSAAPMRAHRAEFHLSGKPLAASIITEAANLTATEIQPVPHHGFSRAYLSECLRVYTRLALTVAVAQAGQTSTNGQRQR
jgi:4-hydroxybenzoyl-CoA reductase beta subunit